MQLDQALHTITIAALPVLFAITLHEAAHGYVARYFGDMTAARKGRISLNPLRHIDPIGTVMLPMLTLWLGGVIFGWAKPVPVNFGALRRPKQDMLWVALAGPASNLLMALAWALLAKFALTMQDNYFAKPMWAMANYGIMINAVLIALNMLPLPPLDGGRVVVSLLPRSLAIAFSKIEPYGMFILIFMAVMPVGNSSLLGMVLLPTANALIHAIALLFGFNFTQ
jgi:Zn-dependent protease